MSFRIFNTFSAKSDLIEIISYYKSISPKLATEFIYRLREAQKYILLSPYGFELKYREVRTVLLKHFPYHIHYLINEESKQIIILAIVHAYKNPKDYNTAK
jgi:plasmid stabilization system protein ParE